MDLCVTFLSGSDGSACDCHVTMTRAGGRGRQLP